MLRPAKLAAAALSFCCGIVFAQFEGKPNLPLDLLREFAPGVKIDWENATIEVQAKVVLREGPIELLACSPRTREHESILVVHAQPESIFQAMGLVGLQPGAPTRYDEPNDRWIPASGEALDLRIRTNIDGPQSILPVEKLFLKRGAAQSPENLRWVFAGSRRSPQGRFAADVAGTVVCVVDFDSALISLDASHSANDAELWLEANTKSIPPLGAPCTLMIKSAERRRLSARLSSDGSLHLGEKELPLRAFVERVQAQVPVELTVVLTVAPAVPQSRIDDVIDALTGAGVKKESVIVSRQPETENQPKAPVRRTEKR